MIPSITPPTDNLYKFISLFGLTILLFSVYNVGITFDSAATNKMKIEDVKVELQQLIYKKSKETKEDLKTEEVKNHFRPGKLRRMHQDLLKIEQFVEKAGLNPKDEISILGKLSKLNVGLDTLHLKKWGYIGFAILGFGFMILGFLKWHYKEQKLRDKMLAIEHALKVLDKTYYREKHSERPAASPSEVVQSIIREGNAEHN